MTDDTTDYKRAYEQCMEEIARLRNDVRQMAGANSAWIDKYDKRGKVLSAERVIRQNIEEELMLTQHLLRTYQERHVDNLMEEMDESETSGDDTEGEGDREGDSNYTCVSCGEEQQPSEGTGGTGGDAGSHHHHPTASYDWRGGDEAGTDKQTKESRTERTARRSGREHGEHSVGRAIEGTNFIMRVEEPDGNGD